MVGGDISFSTLIPQKLFFAIWGLCWYNFIFLEKQFLDCRIWQPTAGSCYLYWLRMPDFLPRLDSSLGSGVGLSKRLPRLGNYQKVTSDDCRFIWIGDLSIKKFQPQVPDLKTWFQKGFAPVFGDKVTRFFSMSKDCTMGSPISVGWWRALVLGSAGRNNTRTSGTLLWHDLLFGIWWIRSPER